MFAGRGWGDGGKTSEGCCKERTAKGQGPLTLIKNILSILALKQLIGVSLIWRNQEPRSSCHFPFPSVPFQRGKPARQPPSEDEEEKSDDNDTMRVSTLLNFTPCNPAVFPPCVYNPCFGFFPPLDGRVQRTLLLQSRVKSSRKTPTPTWVKRRRRRKRSWYMSWKQTQLN